MSECKVSWEKLCEGPNVAFSAGCLINDCLYVHGGVSEARSSKPLSSLHKFSISYNRWELINSNGPCLSHHTCLAVSDHHLLFIGGWNGKQRSSLVYLFDCESNDWLDVGTSGFPVGAGLSSHTANLLANGDVLIIGREGGLRTQRKSGNAFILSGSVDKRVYVYHDIPLGVASRSGHTATAVNNTVLVVGGRDDKLLEVRKIPPAFSQTSHILGLNDLASSLPVISKLPGGRKNHSALAADNLILVYGGETFDGRSKEPVSDIYIIDIQNSYSWKHLGKTGIGRAGHICVLHNNAVIIHGGVGEGNKVSNFTFKLIL